MDETVSKTDGDIVEAVIAELEWDPRVHAEAIEVKVERGVVILLGSVGSWAERMKALEAAQRVVGVRAVSNRIEVALASGDRRTDDELARALRQALDSDVFVSDAKIKATASEGRVILEGEVECCATRDDAERVVRNVRGVRCVINQILIRPAVDGAHRVQKAIEAALERRTNGAARAINLDVHDGKVIVSGVVHCWAERQSVIDAAKSTGGVRSVDDRLIVTPRS